MHREVLTGKWENASTVEPAVKNVVGLLFDRDQRLALWPNLADFGSRNSGRVE